MVPTNNKLWYTTQPGRGGRQKSQLVSACFLPFFKLRSPPPTTHYFSTVPSVAAAVAPAAIDVVAVVVAVVVVVAVGGGGVVGVLLLLMASQFMQSLKSVLFSCLANICQTCRSFQPQDPTSTSGSYGHTSTSILHRLHCPVKLCEFPTQTKNSKVGNYFSKVAS